MKLERSKTKLLYEASFKIEALKIKNEAFLRDFLHYRTGKPHMVRTSPSLDRIKQKNASLCDVNLCDVNLCDVKLCDVSVRVCVMSICVVSVCVMSTCVMSICVMSSCVMSRRKASFLIFKASILKEISQKKL